MENAGLESDQFEGILGRHPSMRAIFEIIRRVAPTDATVLLIKKAFYTLVPLGRSYALHSPLYRMSSLASYLILLPFGLLGARVWRRVAHPPESLFPLALSAVAVERYCDPS